MKKCKFLSILFVFTLLLVSCEKQEELNLNDPNHRIIVTSEMDFENKVIVGGDIDFGDISRGVESRTWILPSNARIVGKVEQRHLKKSLKRYLIKQEFMMWC